MTEASHLALKAPISRNMNSKVHTIALCQSLEGGIGSMIFRADKTFKIRKGDVSLKTTGRTLPTIAEVRDSFQVS